MKCPKCGFNSFEFLDACKKCGAEFGAFKQTHGISPVILRSGTIAETASVPDLKPELAPAAMTGLVGEDSDFSWDAPEEAPASDGDKKPDEGLDFSFSTPDEGDPAMDSSLADFSFTEETEPALPNQSSPLAETIPSDFSFEEPANDIPLAGALSDSTPPEADAYEMLLDPESLSGEADKEGTNVVLNEFEFSGSGDVSFSEPSPGFPAEDEDLFTFEDMNAPEAEQEKKPATNLDDFDKEFKEIFSFEESPEGGEETKGQ